MAFWGLRDYFNEVFSDWIPNISSVDFPVSFDVPQIQWLKSSGLISQINLVDQVQWIDDTDQSSGSNPLDPLHRLLS